MRIVGSGKELQLRARRRLSRGLIFLIGGSLLVVLGFRASELAGGNLGFLVSGLPSFIGLAGVVAGALQIAAAGRDTESGLGEGPVVAQLRARLGDEYVFLRHVKVPGRDVEPDGVLVGPHGVLVLRIRAVNGTFAVDGDDWYVVDAEGERRLWERSPTWELARPLRNVQRTLLEGGFGDVPIQGAVVLVGGRLDEANHPASAVVPVDRISAYIDYLRPEQPVAPEVVDAIAGIFTPRRRGS